MTFPDVPEPSLELRATSDYIKTTSARILAVHAGQQKRLTKGKGPLLFDPARDKCLNVHVAKSWPPWQQGYMDLARKWLDGGTLDLKGLSKEVEKTDMKRAMAFLQGLKRKLEVGQTAQAVLDRALVFDEVKVLHEMVPMLKSTVPRLQEVNIVALDSHGQTTDSEPGNPSVEFVNI